MSRPRYVERGGEAVLKQPIRCSNTTMYTWLVEADWDALHALCDRAFAQPSGGAVVVRPLVPLVAVVAAEIGHGQSQVAPDKDKGWCPERDLGFWVPCARGRMDGDRFEVEQIGWYQPYLFIDNAAAVFTGRETYGFAKTIATCEMPRRPSDPARFAVTTQVIETFTPGTEARVAELYAIERADGGPLGALESTFDTALEAFARVQLALVKGALGAGALPLPTLELVKNLYEGVKEGLVPLFFLKQFRDVTDGSRACYQAIVEAACDLHTFRGGGLLDEHVLRIHAFDSHPIARDLGLPAGPIATGVGFWVSIDFSMMNGKTIWEA